MPLRVEAPHPVRPGSDPIAIGLVNHTPDAAPETPEVRFRSLLAALSLPVHPRLSFLPQVVRDVAAAQRVAGARKQGRTPVKASQIDLQVPVAADVVEGAPGAGLSHSGARSANA